MHSKRSITNGNSNILQPDPVSFVFSADIQFAWCPTDRVKEFCDGGPVVPETKAKKRASGLDLLRPKSSKGHTRFGESQSSSRSFTSLVSDLAPPVPDLNTSRQPLSPRPPPFGNGSIHGSGKASSGKDSHMSAEGWHVVEEVELFPHSIRSPLRIPVTRSRNTSGAGEGKQTGEAVMEHGMQWILGCIQLRANGYAGRDGGILDLKAGGVETPPVYTYAIPKDTPASDLGYKTAFYQSPWEISDIQLVHSSVLAQQHVLSLRLCRPQVLINTSNLSRLRPASKGHHTEPHPSGSRTNILGFRPRGKTFSGRGSIDLIRGADASTSSLADRGLSSPRTVAHQASNATISQSALLAQNQSERDKTFFFSFTSKKLMNDWYLLFRSFARTRMPHEAVFHRRLRLGVLDLTELSPRMTSSNTENSMASVKSKPGESRSRMTDGETRATSGRESSSMAAKKGRDLKPGWTKKGPLCLELIVDGVVRARTTWNHPPVRNAAPFWGESFDVEDLPSFSSCVLAMYRQSKGKALLIAEIALPLVSDIANPKDERYPVKSVVDGAVVGELRLSVAFHEIKRLAFDRYMVRQLVRFKHVDKVYQLDNLHCLDGAYDNLARMDAVDDNLYIAALKMIDREVQGADKTLFRGNTPLTKMLESIMRLISPEFLARSIGPTISRIENVSKTDTPLIVDGKPDRVAVERVWKLIEGCWSDMYPSRGSLPASLQAVLNHLFESVKDTHASSAEHHLPYKALSAFLFLRLMNPALIRPHLFGLQPGLYSPAAQKTATLVARVLSAMSFFSPRESQRDPELALFSDIIVSNTDMMIDYLSSFCTKPSAIPPPASLPPIHRLVSKRVLNLPDAQANTIPVPTIGGPIDRQAEMAMLSALLARRLAARYGGSKGSLLLDAPFGEEESEFMRGLDRNLREVAIVSDVDASDGYDDQSLEQEILSDTPNGTYALEYIPQRGYNQSQSNDDIYLGSDESYYPPGSDESDETPRTYNHHYPSSSEIFTRLTPLKQPPPPTPMKPRPRAESPSPSPFGRVRDTAVKAGLATEAMVMRSLSGKRVGRRGGISALRIKTPGREADDKHRPRTARG